MGTITVETLRQIIVSSGVLTPAERQEWLRLVEFMNDKQLLDLYKILSPAAANKASTSGAPETLPVIPTGKPEPTPTAVTKVVPSVVPEVSPPGIGEGASLSSFLKKTKEYGSGSVQGRTNTEPVTTTSASESEAFKKWKQQFNETIQEKELDSGDVEYTEENTLAGGFPGIASSPSVKEVNAISDALAQKAELPEPAEVAAVLPLDLSAQNTSITRLEDVTNIGIGTFRVLGPEKLYEKLRTLARHKGYFDLLFAFEKSPLYSAYIHTGMKFIQESSESGEAANVGNEIAVYLTREEFESVADILRNLGAG